MIFIKIKIDTINIMDKLGIIFIIITVVALIYLCFDEQPENYYNVFGQYIDAPFAGDDTHMDAVNYRMVRSLPPHSATWVYPWYYPRYDSYYRPRYWWFWTPKG